MKNKTEIKVALVDELKLVRKENGTPSYWIVTLRVPVIPENDDLTSINISKQYAIDFSEWVMAGGYES